MESVKKKEKKTDPKNLTFSVTLNLNWCVKCDLNQEYKHVPDVTQRYLSCSRQEDWPVAAGLLPRPRVTHLPAVSLCGLGRPPSDEAQGTCWPQSCPHCLQLLHGRPFCVHVLRGTCCSLTHNNAIIVRTHTTKEMWMWKKYIFLLNYFQFLVTSWLSNYSLLCQPVDYSTSPLAMRVSVINVPLCLHIFLCPAKFNFSLRNPTQMASVCWWFFFSKVIELSDTVGICPVWTGDSIWFNSNKKIN